MEKPNTISDPTDWLQTELKAFAPLENALRCQVCKDFFNTPMITSCSHTFCSLCIRRCLSAEGKCPACRASEQASKLRRNWAIEEVVSNFQIARPTALQLATSAGDRQEDDDRLSQRPSKRRRTNNSYDADDTGSQRQTRSRTKKAPSPVYTNDTEILDVDGAQDEEQEPDDGLVSCPMCGQRMKEQAVFGHLDRCDGQEDKSEQKKR